jgi:hypothetical protein
VTTAVHWVVASVCSVEGSQETLVTVLNRPEELFNGAKIVLVSVHELDVTLVAVLSENDEVVDASDETVLNSVGVLEVVSNL